MNSNNFRVTVVPSGIDNERLSDALRMDMLESALALRNVLYGIPQSVGIKIALEALDFPHFIPIDNTDEALFQEQNRLRDMLIVLSKDGHDENFGDNEREYQDYCRKRRMFLDIHDELMRREGGE